MPNKHDQCGCGGLKDTRAPMCKACRSENPARSIKDRLLAKIRIAESGCWEFTGFCLPNGYGRIGGIGGTKLAHRVSYEVHVGKIPEGMHVCHHCDNPPCVNPKHLFAGTRSDNAQDMIRKGRAKAPTAQPKTRNMAHWKAKLTPEQVQQIRTRKAEPRKALAAEFGLNARYVSAIICGRKRKYV